MANVPSGWSPAYYAFHAWLRKNRTLVKAGANKTVIYSGMTNGGIPIYRQLPKFRSLITAYFGVDPAWESIEVVLKRIKVDWTKYQEGVTLNPKMVKNYRWMWTSPWRRRTGSLSTCAKASKSGRIFRRTTSGTPPARSTNGKGIG